METHFKCSVEAHPEGARVQSELEVIPHGLFKLVFPLFARTFDKHAIAAAEKIRTTLEARYDDKGRSAA